MSKFWKQNSFRDMSGRIAKSKGVERVVIPHAQPSPLLVSLLNRVTSGV